MAAGLSEEAIDGRLRAGRLHRVHDGVYSVGHQLLPREGRPTSRSVIDVTCPRKSRSWGGIRRHHKALPADEVTIEEGIPVTQSCEIHSRSGTWSGATLAAGACGR